MSMSPAFHRLRRVYFNSLKPPEEQKKLEPMRLKKPRVVIVHAPRKHSKGYTSMSEEELARQSHEQRKSIFVQHIQALAKSRKNK